MHRMDQVFTGVSPGVDRKREVQLQGKDEILENNHLKSSVLPVGGDGPCGISNGKWQLVDLDPYKRRAMRKSDTPFIDWVIQRLSTDLFPIKLEDERDTAS